MILPVKMGGLHIEQSAKIIINIINYKLINK